VTWQSDGTDVHIHRSSRISILFTIVRLTIPGTLIRKVLMYAAIIFGTIWALLFSQLCWICETESGWKSQPHPQCDLGRSVAITQMISKESLFIKYTGRLTNFSRRSIGLFSHLCPLFLHLQCQIVKGAKSADTVCLLHISDHYGC